jgi:hypothetical protein
LRHGGEKVGSGSGGNGEGVRGENRQETPAQRTVGLAEKRLRRLTEVGMAMGNPDWDFRQGGHGQGENSSVMVVAMDRLEGALLLKQTPEGAGRIPMGMHWRDVVQRDAPSGKSGSEETEIRAFESEVKVRPPGFRPTADQPVQPAFDSPGVQLAEDVKDLQDASSV